MKEKEFIKVCKEHTRDHNNTPVSIDKWKEKVNIISSIPAKVILN